MAAASRPLIFISHKHADKDIALAVAKWVSEATDFNMDVFLSSHESFKGPRFGREINKELRAALWRCDVLILIYTTEDREWSYCMWECGVANDASSPETTMLVFQFSDDVPRVLAGTNLVDARRPEELRKFPGQLFTDPEFFPSLSGAAHKPNLPPDVINARADALFASLKERPDFSLRREWATWPYLQIEMTIADVTAMQGQPLAQAAAMAGERATVALCDAKALALFDRANLAPGSRFLTLRPHGAAGGGASWFDACCEQIAVSAADGLPPLSTLPLRSGERDYVPVITKVKQRAAESKVLFDLYWLPLPQRDAGRVAERMLTPDRFFWKSLQQHPPNQTRLAELNRELKAQAKNRVPFLDAELRPRYIIHRSAITECLADHGADEALTLQDLLADRALREVVETSFATVGPKATIAEAALAMQQRANCRDLFVTVDGTIDTPVTGWLTNVDLEQTR